MCIRVCCSASYLSKTSARRLHRCGPISAADGGPPTAVKDPAKPCAAVGGGNRAEASAASLAAAGGPAREAPAGSACCWWLLLRWLLGYCTAVWLLGCGMYALGTAIVLLGCAAAAAACTVYVSGVLGGVFLSLCDLVLLAGLLGCLNWLCAADSGVLVESSELFWLL